MESLWSPVVATGGKRQITQGGNRQIKPNPLRAAATSCLRPGRSRSALDRAAGACRGLDARRVTLPDETVTQRTSVAPSVAALQVACIETDYCLVPYQEVASSGTRSNALEEYLPTDG